MVSVTTDERGLTALAMIAVLNILSSSATASTWEKLVMPGKVIAGHSEYESECKLCHAPLSDRAQKDLCLDCHENVALDVEQRQGYHGRDPAARDVECAECHTDHEGRDADIVGFKPASFDHDLTDFILDGAHLGPGHRPQAPHSRRVPGGEHDSIPQTAREPPLLSEVKTTRVPSGLNLGWPSNAIPLVNGRASPPLSGKV